MLKLSDSLNREARTHNLIDIITNQCTCDPEKVNISNKGACMFVRESGKEL